MCRMCFAYSSHGLQNDFFMEEQANQRVYLCCGAAAAESGTCPWQPVCPRTPPSGPGSLPPPAPELGLEINKHKVSGSTVLDSAEH